ncbi:hypothetical protein [Nitrobacter sp. JJSN]|uniref:hypothetical protein n=1 Tax=Nitrobacter sp. JJSN TaxID=3453033 RepID=UPI003F775AFA
MFKLQPAGAQTDPHDAIAAQLRDLAPRINHETSQTKEMYASTEASQPEGVSLSQAAPVNNNVDALLKTIPRARSNRGILKVLLALCAGVAATTAWHSYGEETKQKLSRLIPQLLMEAPAFVQGATADEPQDTAARAAAPEPTAEEPAQKAATVTPEPSTPSVDPVTTSTQAPPTLAAPSAETAQLLEAMARDIAALKHAVDELKTNEQQLRRETAMAAERESHPKPAQHQAKPALPQRQRASTPPAIPYSPSSSPPPATTRQMHPQGPIQRDAYVPSQAPVSAAARVLPQPGDDSSPRPPMPVQ